MFKKFLQTFISSIVPLVAIIGMIMATPLPSYAAGGVHNWYAIASSSDGQKLVAAQWCGPIETSTDGGITWVNQGDSGSRCISGLASSADGVHLAATDHDTGYIITSSDSGVHWTIQEGSKEDVNNDWYTIASDSTGQKLIAGGYNGFLYTSNDYGVTWTKHLAAGFRSWKSVASSADGTVLVAANQNGYIYVSTNSGSTWVEKTGSGQHNWNSVAISADGTKIAAAAQGPDYIYVSTDTGDNWSDNSHASGLGHWYAIASSSDGSKLAAVNGVDNLIYTSTDSGVTWSNNSGTSGNAAWYVIASSADGSKLAAGVNGGEIYTSTDSGVTWSNNAGTFGSISVTVKEMNGNPVEGALVQAECNAAFTDFGTTDSEGIVSGSALDLMSCGDGNAIYFKVSKTGYLDFVSSNWGGSTRYYYTSVNNNYPFRITPVDTSNTTTSYTAQYWNTRPDEMWIPEFQNNSSIYSSTTNKIDMDWGNGSPNTAIHPDGFMARYNKTTHFDAGTYNFNINGDDGTRIYLDGTMILDVWGGGGNDTSIMIAEGNHTVTVEYYEDGGLARINFSYGLASSLPNIDPVNVYESADTEVSPDVPGTEGSTNNITAHDGSYLVTALAHADSGYDSQVFKFTPDFSGITTPRFNLNWLGHGAIPGDKKVYASLWNFLSSSWDEVTSDHCADDCTLSGHLSGDNYKDGSGNSFAWLKADNHAGAPVISNVNDQGGLLPITWDTDVDATTSLAYDTTSRDNWDDYNYHLGDNGLTSSHTISPSLSSSNGQYWTTLATSADGSHAVGVTSCGYVWTSTDSGETWSIQSDAGYRCWYGAAMSANGSVIAVADRGGYIYISTDGGTTWSNNSGSSGTHYWRQLAMSADGSVIAAIDDNNGYVYVSNDTGLTWSNNSGSSGQHYWRGIASDSTGQKLAAADSNNGYIYTSVDGGVTWADNMGSSGNHYWRTLASSSDGSKLAAIDNNFGYIYLSTDGGATWNQSTGAGLNYWETISMSGDGSKIVAGVNCGDLFTSTDSGASWTDHANMSACWSASAVSTGAEKMYATKYFGDIFTSINSGGSWTDKTGSLWYYRVKSANADGTFTISDEHSFHFDGQSSCPFIFTYDGNKYNYIIDASSSATIGSGLDPDLWAANPFYKDGAYPNPESYVKVPHGFLVPRTTDGQTYYDIKTTFELNEINYYDQAALKVVDHSPNVDVYPDYRNNGQIHTISKTAPAPVSVTTQDGRDVKSLIAANDNMYWHSSKLDDPAYLTIKLSNEATTPANLKIVIKRGKEGQFTGSKKSDKIQYKNSSGVFVDLPANKNPFVSTRAGAPASSRNLTNTYGVDTKVIDLSGLSIKDNEIRLIVTNNQLQWDIDWIAVDTNPDDAVTVTTLDPSSADLHFRGVSEMVPTNPGDPFMKIQQPDYGTVSKVVGQGQPMHGNVTAYGDVLPLLTAVDNKFMIAVQGDELALKYPVPAQAPGTVRDFIYKTWDYHKSWHAPLGDTVEPLPFNEMTRFPYKISEENYPYSANQNYLDTYNTRVIDWGTTQDTDLHHSLNTDKVSLEVTEDAAIPATVTTESVANISSRGAKLSANMASTGTAPVTSQGFYYGKTLAYGGVVSNASNSFDTGTFQLAVTGLSCNTTYHYQAYAYSIGGIATGDDKTFKTSSCPSGSSASSDTDTKSNKPSSVTTVPAVTPSPTTGGTATHLPVNRKKGSSGDDIILLQKFLNNHGFTITTSGPGSKGHETKTFGEKTKNALMKYQKSKGLGSDGILGPKTRSIIEKDN